MSFNLFNLKADGSSPTRITNILTSDYMRKNYNKEKARKKNLNIKLATQLWFDTGGLWPHLDLNLLTWHVLIPSPSLNIENKILLCIRLMSGQISQPRTKRTNGLRKLFWWGAEKLVTEIWDECGMSSVTVTLICSSVATLFVDIGAGFCFFS